MERNYLVAVAEGLVAVVVVRVERVAGLGAGLGAVAPPPCWPQSHPHQSPPPARGFGHDLH